MHELIGNIVSYLDFLENTLRLGVSIHFSHKKLRCLPEDVFSQLVPYNVHKNQYCAFVKKDHWEKCICAQQEILHDGTMGKCFCKTCHAGVKEYISLVYDDNEIASYIAISGYRSRESDTGCIDEAIWRNSLSCDEIPTALLDAVVPPLCRMFELLFRYPLQEDYQGEYNLILQFLHERHGQVTLDDLCEHFGRSKSYISHMFNDRCEMSLPAYCNALKLDYAKTLLAKICVPITEVALDVGYNDVSYFILRFKERFGFTPLQYRKMITSNSEERN